MVRLKRPFSIPLALIAASIIGAIGVAPPSRAAASPPTPTLSPSQPARHAILPPRHFVPAPLRAPDKMVVVQSHGLRFKIPARTTLTPALRAYLTAPRPVVRATRVRDSRATVLPVPRRRLALAPASAAIRALATRRGLIAPRGVASARTASAASAALTPPNAPPLISIGAVQGQFFADSHNSGAFTDSDGVFTVKPGTPPLFTQQFAAIDFNPPPAAQHCSNNTGVDSNSRPFVDVIPQADGSCLTQTVQGNGAQAGVDLSGQGGPNMEAFQAVFTAYVTVAKAGPISFHFYADDGWIAAMGPDAAGDQPTRDPASPGGSAQAAPRVAYPTNGPFTGYPVVAADDRTSAPDANDFTVDFPAAGTYPVEVDYTECCQGELALTLGTQYGDPLLPSTVSSLPVDQNRNTDQCPCAQPSTNNPVNTRTGNYWTDETDLVVSSPGPSLGWVRTYNSQATGDADQPGILGYGWSVPYMTHVITAGATGGEPGVAIVASTTDNRWRFQDLGNGQFQPFPGVYATLTQAGGVYTETLRTGEQISFDATGRAIATTDAQGRQVLLQYNGSHLTRIVDGANQGRYLALDYDTSGAHVIAAHDPAGRTMRYSYDGNGDLVGTTDVMGRAAAYHYQNHLLTELDNTLGQSVERNAYDVYAPSGRVISQTLQDGEWIALAYVPDHTTITTTGTDGTQDVEQVLYDAQRNVLTGIVKSGVLVQQTEFDGNFAPDLIVDGDGNQTHIVSNGAGLPQSVTNATGATSQIVYNAQNRPITQTDPLGRQSILGYDSNGNVVSATTGITTDNSLGATTAYTYNVRYPGENWLEEQRTPDGIVTHYDYDATGQITAKTVGYGTAQAQITAYGYDAEGRVVTNTIGAGTAMQRIDVTRYNDDNTVAQVIMNYKGTGVFDLAHSDQNATAVFGYDALGRPTWVRDALGHYDVAHYDAAGQADWTVRDLSPATLDASGQLVVPATPPAFSPAQPDQNVATFYGYDGLGRETLVTETGILTGTFDATTRTFAAAMTRVTRTEYDALSRPITTTLNYRPDVTVGPLPDANVQTVTQYDNQGNVLGQRDALGRWTYIQYDGLNRPVTTTVNYENGDPTTVDPANASWTDGHDTDLIRVVRYGADSNVSREMDNYVHGAFSASQPITDRVTQYGYDGQGRAITTTVNVDPATLGVRSDTNRTTVAAYDTTTGRLIGQRDTLGRWTSERYDQLGRETATIEDCRDSGGNPIAQGCAPFDPSAPDRNVSTQTRYDALGRAFEMVDALGHVTHTTYDGLDQAVTTIENYVPGGPTNADTNVTTSFAYDALGRTAVVTDALGQTTSYGYNGLGEATAITDTAGRVTYSGFDGSGALRWTATADGRLTVLHVDGLGRVVTAIQNYHTGAATSTTPDQDLTTRTVYDAAGRKVQTVDPMGRIAAFGYDLLDHII